MKLSICINADTRPERNCEIGLGSGTVSRDYLTDGIFNKIKFFEGFDIETIVCIDEHLPVPEETLAYIRALADTVLIRKHTNEPSFNCWNYWRAFALATGDIVCHVDQDTACFTSSQEPINQMLMWLETHKFVSYPSHWSPVAVQDPSFEGRMWSSTRFFMCKRETLKLDELRNCILEPEWGYEKYGIPARKLNWTEHFLTLINDNSVFYPPIESDKYLIFSWASYSKWLLRRLNNLRYSEVVDWVISRGGIQYPVDVNGCD